MSYTVSRGAGDMYSDQLDIYNENGEHIFRSSMNPTDRRVNIVFHRPWYFTGSEFGEHIIGEMWEKHAQNGGSWT